MPLNRTPGRMGSPGIQVVFRLCMQICLHVCLRSTSSHAGRQTCLHACMRTSCVPIGLERTPEDGRRGRGACQGVIFNFEHVGEFEAIFETALGPESKAMKILELKIFRHSPFNDAMQDVKHCKKNEEKKLFVSKDIQSFTKM